MVDFFLLPLSLLALGDSLRACPVDPCNPGDVPKDFRVVVAYYGIWGGGDADEGGIFFSIKAYSSCVTVVFAIDLNVQHEL